MDDATARPRMPSTVLAPVGLYVIAAITCALSAVFNVINSSDRAAATAIMATVAVVSIVTAVGMWRAWPPARQLGIGVAVLLLIGALANPGLLVLAVALTGIIVGCLLTASAQAWFEPAVQAGP